jgi:hypothetical protein
VTTLTHQIVLVDTSCVSCGIVFGVPDWWDRARRDELRRCVDLAHPLG